MVKSVQRQFGAHIQYTQQHLMIRQHPCHRLDNVYTSCQISSFGDGGLGRRYTPTVDMFDSCFQPRMSHFQFLKND